MRHHSRITAATCPTRPRDEGASSHVSTALKHVRKGLRTTPVGRTPCTSHPCRTRACRALSSHQRDGSHEPAHSREGVYMRIPDPTREECPSKPAYTELGCAALWLSKSHWRYSPCRSVRRPSRGGRACSGRSEPWGMPHLCHRIGRVLIESTQRRSRQSPKAGRVTTRAR